MRVVVFTVVFSEHSRALACPLPLMSTASDLRRFCLQEFRSYTMGSSLFSMPIAFSDVDRSAPIPHETEPDMVGARLRFTFAAATRDVTRAILVGTQK